MNTKKIGQNIDTIRKERGWSKAELTRRVGSNPAAVGRHIQTGDMTVKNIAKYSEVLGCTISDIMDGAADPTVFHLETDVTSFYPYNLVAAIYGINRSDTEEMERIYRVYIPGLIKEIQRLSEREQEVLRLRFYNNMTLEDAGKIIGVTRTRINQIEAKALRHLRNPQRKNNWEFDVAREGLTAKCEAATLRVENDELRAKLKRISNIIGSETEETNTTKYTTDFPIEEMELTNRTYYCLKKARINTLLELCNCTPSELLGIRRFGAACLSEVVNKLNERGVELKKEDCDGREDDLSLCIR